jgi:hypothetical protein
MVQVKAFLTCQTFSRAINDCITLFSYCMCDTCTLQVRGTLEPQANGRCIAKGLKKRMIYSSSVERSLVNNTVQISDQVIF